MTSATPTLAAGTGAAGGGAGAASRGAPIRRGSAVGLGVATLWLSIVVLLPLATVVGQAAAGGFTEGANRKEVVVIRRQDQGRLAAFRINTDKVLNNPEQSREIALRGQDIVYVPRSGVGQVGDFVTLYFRDVVNPLLLTLLSIDELHTRHFLFE